MNGKTRAYCDGASMAYKDVADKLRSTINNAPPQLQQFMTVLEPFEKACRIKAQSVYQAAKQVEKEVN